MSRSLSVVLCVLALCFAALGCGNDSDIGACSEPLTGECGPDDLGRCTAFDALRKPLWGDTHIHTNLSLDANLQGTRTSQEDAYAFAQGAPIALQPYDADGTPTRMAQIDRPLDFVMLSDHAEFLGTIRTCLDSDSPAYENPTCEQYRDALEFDAPPTEVRSTFVQLNLLLAAQPDNAQYPELCGPEDVYCIEAGMDVWAEIVDAAEAVYDRTDSCQFTAFAGYEWSGVPGGNNLHRNVMFKNESVTDLPYGYFDEPYVEGLWARLLQECIDAGNGCDVVTIPHNTNISDGIYFENQGEPFTAEYVAARNAMEPVIEIYQHKGASECLPGETISDELCGFEIIPFSDITATNLEIISPPDPTGFLRYAYGEGMKFEASLGTNPFQYGITAATDTHVSAPGFAREDDFKGHGGAGQPNRYLPPPQGFPDIEYLSPGGLTAVWAEENARTAIFSAIRRKETFGTSGPRIVVRAFGGWDLTSDLCNSADLARIGYEQGVPMGGELSNPPEGSTPKFVVSAKQDPDPMSAPLQRIQIIKGWLDGGEYQVAVYDVAGNPDNGASVDLSTCERQGTGSADLCAVWEDTTFDPAQRAYYYVRVIENPSCRWSAQQCADAEYDCADWDFEECAALSNYTCDCCNPTTGLNVGFCDVVAESLTGDEAACCRTDNPTSSINVKFCADLAKDLVADGLPAADAQCCLPRLETAIQERAWTSPIWYQPPS